MGPVLHVFAGPTKQAVGSSYQFALAVMIITAGKRMHDTGRLVGIEGIALVVGEDHSG